MAKFLWTTIFFFISFSFTTVIIPCLCDQPRDLISCLNQDNVNNFTTYESAAANNYYNLLNYSIQNLRFTEPSLPKPTAIILPTNRGQLVKSVLCCKRNSLEIRVRCGGHSYEGTSSVAADGTPFAIIDMMNLDRVWMDSEAEVAWVEGGATLGQTYYEIARRSNHTRGFSGGSCPTVGVGGHISGGGFGFLSRKYGLAADNVVDALLVDAEGRLLDREAMGEDVFWAIRGGGGGVWGIILAWKIKLLEVPKMVTGFTVSRPAAGTKDLLVFSKLAHKWQSVAPKLEGEFYLSLTIGAGLPEIKEIGKLSATFRGFYMGPRSKAVSMLKRVFPELGIVEEDCKEMSWIESVLYFSGLETGSTVNDLKDRYLKNKGYYKAKSDYVKTPISLRGIKKALDILGKEPKGYVILDPYGGIMDRISSDSIAFPHRRGNLFSIQYLVEWKEEDNEKSNGYIEWMRGFYRSMAPYVSWGPRAAYVNYMDLDLGAMDSQLLINTNNTSTSKSSSSSSSASSSSYSYDDDDAVEVARVWGQKYFLHNYDRLVGAKTLIDPNNVFRHQQGIPPVSSKASLEGEVIISDVRKD